MYRKMVTAICVSLLFACSSSPSKDASAKSDVLKKHEVTVQEKTRIRVGVPSDRPSDVLDKLSQYFATNPNVQLAKLGLMETINNNGHSTFHYVIGVQLKDESKRRGVMERMIIISKSAQPGRWPLAFVPLNGTYFTSEAIVFYSL